MNWALEEAKKLIAMYQQVEIEENKVNTNLLLTELLLIFNMDHQNPKEEE